MKHLTKTLIVIFTMNSFVSFSQLDSNEVDSLITQFIYAYDSSGLVKFKPNSLQRSELFTIYESYFYSDNDDNSMVLQSSIRDPFVSMDHDKYQQHYKGIPIEGAYFIEHSLNNYVSYVNGMVANLEENISDTITKEEALTKLSTEYDWQGDPVFAWESDAWEAELKEESGNPDTTYFPYNSGKLVYALWNYNKLSYHIGSEHLRLAYAFDILSVKPFFHNTYYVDARTGEVFDVKSKIHFDGPATIPIYGSVTIDTKSRGIPYNDHILKAEGGNHNFHTKYYEEIGGLATPFSLISEIDDNDDNWGTNDQRATASHWILGETWDFFSDAYGHEGVKGNGKKVKLKANHAEMENAYYHSDEIVIGVMEDQHLSFLDVIGHEFTHGVDDYSAELIYEKESGALDESFADIFGFMVERYSINPTSNCTGGGADCDWLIGEDLVGFLPFRNMINPNARNQPDTYEDVANFWVDVTNCVPECDGEDVDYNDCCGVHTNSGVQNRWFSLLSLGGIHNGINVTSIGIDDAALIAFYNLRFNLTEAAGFEQARSGSIAAAVSLFGECSQRHRSTADAWDAVGVDGTPISCPPLAISEQSKKDNALNVVPNPNNGTFTLYSVNQENLGDIQILSVDGKLINEYNSIQSANLSIEMNTPSGVYFVRRIVDGNIQVSKLIVQ